MFRPLLVLTLVAGTSLAAPQDAFTRFDAWAETWRAGTSPLRRSDALAEGVTLATAREVALRALMQTDGEAAARQMRPRHGLPAQVVSHMELELDTPARVEVTCEYGAALKAELKVGPRHYLLPASEAARFPGSREVHVTTWVLGERAIITQLRGLGGARDTQPSSRTVGNKRVLYIRVDFSDDPGAPIDVAGAQAALAQLDQFLRAGSYNRTQVTGTVTSTVVRVPGTKASYGGSNNTSGLLSDARNASRAAGFDPDAYDYDVVAFRNVSAWSWAGLGQVGGKGTWLNGSFGLGVLAHEIGHNLGLSHANFWLTSGDSIIGAGSAQEYGNPFDIMGGGGGARHYNAWYKNNLDWFNASEFESLPAPATGNTGGTYRISDLEQPILGGLHAVRVPISGARDYWIEYRAQASGLNNAALIFWGFPNPQTSLLLDMVPWTQAANDAPLKVGRTFADTGAGIFITPVAVVAASPPALDVVVHRGDFSNNRAPTVTLTASGTQVALNAPVTFTAAASDPDGDPLAYFWDFEDTAASTNVSMVTRSFSSAREVVARVTVSDMKGRTASASVLVRVGMPTSTRVTGRVTEAGAGLEGVRIVGATSTGFSKQTFTSSDGTYTLTGVPVGQLSLTAVKNEYTTVALFPNPVTVPAGGVGGNDFGAFRAVFGILGRVTSVGQPVAGVTVSAGPYSRLTDTTGVYALPVPAGVYTVVATGAPGEVYKPAGFTNPVSVTNTAVNNVNFEEDVVPVSGVVVGQPGPHTVSNGPSAVQSTETADGGWAFRLPRVGPGTWNVVASAPGQVIFPTFTNPVPVAGLPITGLIFNSVPGTAWTISGVVDELGSGLPGAAVTAVRDGGVLGTSTTDSRGRYVLLNLGDGTYTVTPSRSGYTFGPVAREVPVAGADVVDQHFSVQGANAPPVIVVPPTADPFPVTGTTADLFVLADDPAPGQEQDLVYTWTQTVGPAPATLSRNASNGAKSTTATFTRAGAYAFRVEVKDPGNLKVGADLPVVVPPTVSRVAVMPPMATVDLGGSRQFTGSMADQFGAAVPGGGEATWEVVGDCGTVSAIGRFTANKVGTCEVKGTIGSLTGSAMVTVVVGPIPRVVSGPTVTPRPVVGSRARAAVLGTDDDGEAALVYTWSTMDPPAPVGFAPNGTNPAKDTVLSFSAPGTYLISVEVKDTRENTAAEFLSVEVLNGLSTLTIEPAAASVTVGKAQAFTVSGKDFMGAGVATGPCTWSATGGTIDGSGTFTPGAAAGDFTVTATCDLWSASTTVKVATALTQPPGGCGCAGVDGVAPLLGLALVGLLRRRARGPRA